MTRVRKICSGSQIRAGLSGYVAESASFFMSGELGLPDTVMEGHVAYIGHWLEILRNDKTALFTAAARGEEAVNWLKANASGRAAAQIAA